MKKWIIWIAMFLLILISCTMLANPAQAEDTQPKLKLVDATAYYDSYGHGKGADGRKLIEGVTIAGRVEDLGKTAVLYDEDMRLIGIYEFRDVGYGQPTGKGKSEILKGKTKGTIETGQCVDIYFKTYQQCKSWGRRKVYMQIVRAEG